MAKDNKSSSSWAFRELGLLLALSQVLFHLQCCDFQCLAQLLCTRMFCKRKTPRLSKDCDAVDMLRIH